MKSLLLRTHRASTDEDSDLAYPGQSLSLIEAWKKQAPAPVAEAVLRAVEPFASALLVVELSADFGVRNPVVSRLSIHRVIDSPYDDLDVLHLARPHVASVIKRGRGCEISGPLRDQRTHEDRSVHGWLIPLRQGGNNMQSLLVIIERVENPLIAEMAERLAALRRKAEASEVRHTEIVHRTKNHLQLIASLLHQTASTADPTSRDTLHTASMRLGAIAAVQARLTQGPPGAIVALDDLLGDLCTQVSQITGLACDLSAEHIEVPSRSAVALAEMVNELLVNSAKHAFHDHEGRITVECTSRRGYLRINIVQVGQSFPPGFVGAAGRGVGMKIVQTLARQVGADIVYSPGPPSGAVELICPLRRLH